MEVSGQDLVSIAQELALMNFAMGKQIDELVIENERLVLENISLQARLDEINGVSPWAPQEDGNPEVTIVND